MRVALVAPDCDRRDGQARYVSEIAPALSGGPGDASPGASDAAGPKHAALNERPAKAVEPGAAEQVTSG